MAQNNNAQVGFNDKFIYGIGGISDSIMGGIVFTLALKIYNLEYGVDAAMVGLGMFIPRLWDAVAGPLVGSISDRTVSTWGRRRPFMFFGALAAGLLCMVLWSPPSGLSSAGLFWYFTIISTVFFTGYAVFSVPYTAMGFEITQDYHQRTSVVAYKIFFCTISNFVFMSIIYRLCFVKFLGQTPIEAVKVIGVIYGIIIITFGLIPAVFCKAAKAPSVTHKKNNLLEDILSTRRNKPFMLINFAGFFVILGVYIVGTLMTYINLAYVYPGDKPSTATLEILVSLVFGIAGFSSVPLAAILSRRIGKKNTMIASLCIMILAFLLSWLYITPNAPYAQIIYALLVSSSMTVFCIVSGSMVADVCDYDQYQTGMRREGLYASVAIFTTKLALAIALAFNGVFIKLSGFAVNQAVQSESTIMKLRLIYMLVPSVFILIGILLFCKYNLSQKLIEEMQEKVKGRAGEEDVAAL